MHLEVPRNLNWSSSSIKNVLLDILSLFFREEQHNATEHDNFYNKNNDDDHQPNKEPP
ncbi:MAG: hypothetical protein OXH31_03920 [Gammaproteobacteria bacterium]|nr:hypothetical protein [Gammaproteobacteria bacterium]